MKSTNLGIKLREGGKFYSMFSYDQNCFPALILVILLSYMYTCHIILQNQRQVVIGAYEMHYF